MSLVNTTVLPYADSQFLNISYPGDAYGVPQSSWIIGQLNLLAWQNVNWTPSDIDKCGGYCQGQKRKYYPPGSPMNLTLFQTNPLPVGGFQAGVYDLGQVSGTSGAVDIQLPSALNISGQYELSFQFMTDDQQGLNVGRVFFKIVTEDEDEGGPTERPDLPPTATLTGSVPAQTSDTNPLAGVTNHHDSDSAFSLNIGAKGWALLGTLSALTLAAATL